MTDTPYPDRQQLQADAATLSRVFAEIAGLSVPPPSWDLLAMRCAEELAQVETWIRDLHQQHKRGQLAYILEALQGIRIVMENRDAYE